MINSDNGSAQVTKDLQVLREQITQANTYAVSGDVEQFSKKYEQLTGHKYSAKDVAVLSTDGMSDSIENYAQSQKSGVDVLSTIGSVAAVVAVTRGNASAGATLLKGALAGGTAKSALTLGQADTNFLHEFGRGAVIGGSMIAGELAAGKVSSHVALNKSLVLEGEGRFARIATAGLDYSKQGLKTRLTSAAAYHGTMGSVVCATATVGDELVNSANEGRLPEVSRTIAAAAAGGVLGFGLGTGLGFVSGAVIDGLVTKQSPKLLAEVRQPKLLTEGTPPLTEVPPPAVVVEVAEKIEPAKLATNELDDLLQKYNVAADRIGTNQNNAQALRGLADAMKAGKPYEITPEIRALVSEEQWAKILDPKNPEVWRLGMQAWKLDRMIAKDQLLADELGNRIIAVNEAAAEAPVVSEVVTPAPTALSKAPDLLKDPAFIDRELHRADLFGKRDHLIAGMLKEEAEVSGSFADISNKQLRQEVEELIAGKDAAEILNLAEERLARAQRWQNYIDYLNKAKAKIA